jgi:DHA3 family macrolide efflux protein-like MFS transporter
VETRDVASSVDPAGAVPESGVRSYALIWCTQWIAMIAGAVSGLVLAIYIYDEYDSLVLLGLGFASAYVPFVLACPVAGALTDRWGQRRALLVSNTGTLVGAAVLAVLLAADALALWHAAVLLTYVVALKALQLTALESIVPLLVPVRHYLRVNGSRMLLTGTAAVMAPVLTGLMLQLLDVVSVVAVACAAVLPAILVAVAVRIPAAAPAGVGVAGSLRAEIAEALRQLRSAHGLVALLAFLAAISVVIAFLELGIQQLVYGFAGDLELVLVLTVGWSGIVVTSIAMTISGQPRRLVPGMLLAGLVFSVALIAGGLRPNLVLVMAAAFVALGCTPIIVGGVQTVLHLKVPPRLLGRAMGLKNAMTGTAHITGNVSAGLLGAVVVPLVGREEVRSPVVSAAFGDGGARGFAVLMVSAGITFAGIVWFASRHRRLARWQDGAPEVGRAERAGAATAAEPVPAPR